MRACHTRTPIFDPTPHAAVTGVPTVDTCCYCGAEPAEVFVGFEYPDAWRAAADAFRGDEANRFVRLELHGRCAVCKRLVAYTQLARDDAGPA